MSQSSRDGAEPPDGQAYIPEPQRSSGDGHRRMFERFRKAPGELASIIRREKRGEVLLAAVDAINSLIVVSDPNQEDNPLVFANEHFLAYTGYEEDEVLGANCRFLQRRLDGTMDSEQEGLDRIRRAIEHEEHTRAVIRNYRKDGTMFWNELYISPVRDTEGRLTHFIGVQNDVTRLKEAQDRLRESADTLTSFFDGAPLMMGIVERQGGDGPLVHVRANRLAADFFGTTPEAVVGCTDDDLGITGPCGAGWRGAFAEALRERRYVRFECEMRRRGGDGEDAPRYRGFQEADGTGLSRVRTVSFVVDHVGTVEGRERFSYIAEDVTERRRAERERRLLEAAVEHVDESLVITEAGLDAPGPRFIYVNPAFEALTGYTDEDIAGRTPRILQGADTDPDVLDRLRRDLRARRHFRGETLNYRKDGTPFYNEWHVAPILADDGETVTHWVATQRDVTERREAEEEVRRLNRDLEARVRERTAELQEKNEALRAANDALVHAKEEAESAREEAEAANRAKGSFLANMSHEIRTPLTAILGFATLLTRRIADDHRPYAERIERAGNRLMDTLNLVLELTRLDAGQVDIALEEVALAGEVEEAVELFRARAEAKGLTLRFETDPGAGGAAARVDRGALASILNNLIGNAVKFTDRGAVTVTLSAADGRAQVRVRDTGIGIASEFMPKLFGEFMQASTGPGRSHEGSGLGLAISLRLAHLMDGDIEVDSTPGEGATFSVYVPLTTHTAMDPALHTAGTGRAAAGRPRVLLVEDNEDTRFLLQSLLEDACALESVATAEEAQRATSGGTPYDLVLLDINLGPGRSGADLIGELRASEAYADVPVVALTAYALPGDREKFEGLGFTSYLAKPFKVDDLVTLIDELLER